jgi:hypothetical protein
MYSNHNDSTQTISSSGCGPTSMAMVVSTLNGTQVKPPVLCQYALDNGFRTYDDGTAWGFFASAASQYGINCRQVSSLSEVKTALSDGEHMVIASMGPKHFTGEGHFIALNGVETINGTDWYSVIDPNKNNTRYGNDGKINVGTPNDGYVKARSDVFTSEAVQYWIFDKSGSGGGTGSADVVIAKLSEKYESRYAGGAGCVANTPGDSGGKSYGAWQLASATGSVDAFLNWLSAKGSSDTNTREAYGRLIVAKKSDGGFGTSFDNTWKTLADENYDSFLKLQMDYIKPRYYDKAVAELKNIYGFDVNTMSSALKAVMFSTSVQHGTGEGCTYVGAVPIFRKALEKCLGLSEKALTNADISTINYSNINERQLIDEIYKERSRKVTYDEMKRIYVEDWKNDPGDVKKIVTMSDGNVLYHFNKNGHSVQDSVYKRLSTNEKADALKMYDDTNYIP